MRWSYKRLLITIGVADGAMLDRMFNELGDQGWEIFQILPVHNGMVIYAKRALPQ